MKRLFLLWLLMSAQSTFGQDVIPMLDLNERMKSFENGFFRSIALQPVREYKAGDNVVGYVDFRNNLMVHNGGNPEQLSNVETKFEVSDNLLVWNIATTLNIWDDGEQKTLTFQVGQYEVRDSLVVFQDLRYNSVKVYYKGEIIDLYTSSGVLTMPDYVGENIVAYRDNGNYNKIFWRGEIHDLDVWHEPYKFSGGTDMVAFNDPVNGTFAIFEKGEFFDVENFHMDSYKVGNGFVAYKNLNGDLKMYQDGEIIELASFASFWVVRDNVVYWEENGFTYAYIDGTKIEVSRYIPADYKVKNGVVAFRNVMGGVSAVQNGKVIEITNQMDAGYSIHGNSVLARLFNNSYIVLQEGKMFRN